MSSLRTSLAMIGFGFTIAQFLEQLANRHGAAAALHPAAPRVVGLSLIAAGSIALLISTWQYRALLDYLWSDPFRSIAPDRRRMTSVYALTISMVAVGILLFIAIAFRFI